MYQDLEQVLWLLSEAQDAHDNKKPDVANKLWRETQEVISDMVKNALPEMWKMCNEARRTIEYDTQRMRSDEERIKASLDFWRGFSDSLLENTIETQGSKAYDDGYRAAYRS